VAASQGGDLIGAIDRAIHEMRDTLGNEPIFVQDLMWPNDQALTFDFNGYSFVLAGKEWWHKFGEACTANIPVVNEPTPHIKYCGIRIWESNTALHHHSEEAWQALLDGLRHGVRHLSARYAKLDAGPLFG
jgi:hypothetical protein